MRGGKAEGSISPKKAAVATAEVINPCKPEGLLTAGGTNFFTEFLKHSVFFGYEDPSSFASSNVLG